MGVPLASEGIWFRDDNLYLVFQGGLNIGPESAIPIRAQVASSSTIQRLTPFKSMVTSTGIVLGLPSCTR